MKKLLVVILAMLVATSLFAEENNVKVITDSWGESLSGEEYQFHRVRTDADERE